MKAVILTSCIVPNSSFHIESRLSPQQRLDDLLGNLHYLFEANLFDIIIVVDCSNWGLDEFSSLRSILQNSLKLLGDKVHFHQCGFDSTTLAKIVEKGKGYSELLMFQQAIRYATRINSKITSFTKISARYKVKNIRFLLSKSLSALANGYVISFPFSILLSKASSVFYVVSASFADKFIDDMLKKIDDRKGLYIEYILFSEYVDKLFVNVYRLPAHPIYPSTLIGGSGQGKYSFYNQIKRQFVFSIF